jgi:hypothetical protein
MKPVLQTWCLGRCRCSECGNREMACWPVTAFAPRVQTLKLGETIGFLQCNACGDQTLYPIAPAIRLITPDTVHFDCLDAIHKIERHHLFN